MTTWSVKACHILDEPADALVVSANPYLTMSGGVGGAFLLRYGDTMQQMLRAHLNGLGRRHVPRGTLVPVAPCGAPYRVVFHAVAVDAMYESSPDVVAGLVAEALAQAGDHGARAVALPALATGYGRLSVDDFGRGIAPLWLRNWSPVERVIVCVRDGDTARRVSQALEAAA